MSSTTVPGPSSIKAIDKATIHGISSGQVIVDLQGAVKELVENSLDAGATSIEVRFKHWGLTSVEVVDNGCGIAEKDWEGVGLKHYTSKLTTFDDLSTVRTFGFRGEAVSSLCALCDHVVVTTATDGPMGIQLDLEQSGKVEKKTKVARQRGTTVMFTRLFASLPVRRKELQRTIKREFGKALGLLNAYALGPCAGMDSSGRGVRLSVINQTENGQKIPQIKTEGVASFKVAVTALWGLKAMDNTVELNLDFRVQQEKSVARRTNDKYCHDSQTQSEDNSIPVQVKGLISKFSVGCGRPGTDRQFFYVNGRPCNLTKIQKAFNEVYRSFNANQAPFILADFTVPTEYCDINVSPDKRLIFMQSEQNLIDTLKEALETAFSSHSSTFDVNGTQPAQNALTQIAFDSPYSKRLSIKSSKSGNHSSKSQPEPPKSAHKEKEIPLADDDLGQGEVSRTDDSAEQLSLVDKPADTTRPVTKRIDQLLKASSSSRSKTRSGNESNQAEEPGAGQKSLRPSKEAQQGSPHAEPMNVDQPPEGERTREKENPEPVVDTTKAVWNKFMRKEPVPEGRADKTPETVEETEGPAAKKRRVEVEGNQVPTTSVDQSVIKTSTTKSGGTTSIENLRNRLARYASGSAQVANPDEGRTTPVEDRMDEAEDEECNDERKKQEKRGTKSSDATVITLSAKVDTTRKGRRKNEGTSQKPIEIDGDEDTLMDEGFEASTSSTIAMPDDQTSKLVTEDNSLTASTVPPTDDDHGQRPEIIRNPDTVSSSATALFDLEQVKNKWKNRRKGPLAIIDEVPCTSAKISADASLANTEDNESAARALERVIDKSDFASMDILGQFNLGFIIVRRRKNACDEEGKEGGIMDDLFIVDQHAADEKYNFETLQQTTKIQSQKLFKPRPLELTAADELVAMENIDIIKDNGFDVEVDETAAAGQGARFQVTAFPVSKNTEFGMKDLEELIDLMRDQPSGRMVRCSKARAMFAMRACRKSVMIGMALNQSQMTSVVQHMGTMDQPWNCPHGRPTMRHLIDLCQTSLQSPPRTINWSALNDMT